jgi:hypothetical protein
VAPTLALQTLLALMTMGQAATPLTVLNWQKSCTGF